MPDPVSFSSATPRHGLPHLFSAQSQKEFIVNESLARLDILLHCAVEGEADSPPADPVEGACWLIGPTPTGPWDGAAESIAGWQADTWTLIAPVPGMRIYDRSSGQTLIYDGAWQRPSQPALPAGGTVIDTEARTAIGNLIETLTNAGIFPVGS